MQSYEKILTFANKNAISFHVFLHPLSWHVPFYAQKGTCHTILFISFLLFHLTSSLTWHVPFYTQKGTCQIPTHPLIPYIDADLWLSAYMFDRAYWEYPGWTWLHILDQLMA